MDEPHEYENLILASRNGGEVRGHWSTAPTFVAGARLALERFGMA